MKKRVRINGVLVGLAIIICLVFLKFLLPGWRNSALNKVLAVVAFSLFLVGQMLRILGRAYKIEHSARGEALVKQGLYTVVRNPMYLGSFLSGISFTLLLGNFWVILAFLVIFFARFFPQVRREEKFLLKNFGKVYEEYTLLVPRFIPKKIYKSFKADLKKYLRTTKFPWVKKELFAALGWFVLFLLVALLKDLSIYGLSEYLWELSIFTGVVLVLLVFLNTSEK